MAMAGRPRADARSALPIGILGRGAVIAALALGLGARGGAPAAAGGEAPSLRVCADQDNLPFTSSSATPGFYMELARHLAGQLNRPLEPVWASTYVQKRMLRTTLLAHKCDMFFGVPFDAENDGKRVLLSAPVIRVGYALVARKGSPIADVKALSGKRVAVQFGTPVQAWIADRDDVEAVTVTSPEEGMQALERGRADAALLWGPSAGYLNATAVNSRYRVTPLGEPVEWSASIAFAPESAALRDDIDRLLARDSAEIRTLATKYAFPMAAEPAGGRATIHKIAAQGGTGSGSGFDENLTIPPVNKGAPLPPGAPRQKQMPAGEGAGSTGESSKPAPDASVVAPGRDLFNSNCAHCHGPNAIQSERRINLRLLRHRYANEVDKVFMKTVMHGRVEKGMPNWSGAFTDDQLEQILAFLKSVQEEQ